MIAKLRLLADNIAEELEGAEEYCRQAMRHAEEHPDIAKEYLSMSGQEAHHAEELYEIGCKMISGAGDDATVKTMWTSWAKPMMEEKLVRIKVMQSMVK